MVLRAAYSARSLGCPRSESRLLTSGEARFVETRARCREAYARPQRRRRCNRRRLAGAAVSPRAEDLRCRRRDVMRAFDSACNCRSQEGTQSSLRSQSHGNRVEGLKSYEARSAFLLVVANVISE